MRGVTLGVIGAAAAVLLAIVVLMRGGDETAQQPVSPAPVARPRVGSPGGNAAGEDRNVRVEDRLGALRAEYERRRAGDSPPAASQRVVPTASEKSARLRQDAEDEMLAEEGDDDPEELAEARETLFNNQDPDERIGAILMLTGSEGPESMRLLMEAMDDPDAEVRLAVVEALGDRVEELTPGLLSKPLRDADPEVRFEAVSVLGDMENNTEALDLVKSATEDPDEDVRALAEGIMDFSEDEDDAADNGK
jgi:hypothetical protein